jgi:hypothetical protein
MQILSSKHSIRILSLAILSLFGFTFGGLSKEKPAGDAPKIQVVDGYTIKVVRVNGGSYGYEIRRGPDILVRQRRNPYTGSEEGLMKREDAMKTATWLVKTVLEREQILPQNRRLPARILSTRSIPKSVARELRIAID